MTGTHASSRRPLALAIALVLTATTARAATITVTTGGDPDPSGANICTLRQAILLANGSATNIGNCAITGSGANTIVFDAALNGSTITMSYPDPVGVVTPLTIQGSNQTIIGANAHYAIFDSSDLTVSNLTISGANNTGHLGGAFRLKNATLTLMDVTLSDNTASLGGGIYANNSTLTLTNTTISGNRASSSGGGISAFNSTVSLTNSTISGNSGSSGGGIRADYASHIMLTGSTITNNTATYSGGGVMALRTGTSLTLDHTTVTDNMLASYSVLHYGGGLYVSTSAYAKLTASTISGNSGFRGGGISARNSANVKVIDSTISHNGQSYSGGGLDVDNSTVTLVNSTLTGNAAHSGGAASELSAAYLMLFDSTVSANTANTGGGVDANLGSTLALTNTILSGNSGSQPDANVVGGSVFSAYNSLLGTAASPGAAQNNVISDSPGLSALAYHGGPTQTMALSPTSPALDVGDNTKVPAGVMFDQRGTGNPRISNSTVDIGAFEHNVDVIFADGFEP